MNLDTKITPELIKQIDKEGHSRIPIALSANNSVIVAIMTVKSLIAVDQNGMTIGNLYRRNELALKVPLYLTSNANISVAG